MMDSNDTKIPMDLGTKLVKAEDGNLVDATYYRSLIRSLSANSLAGGSPFFWQWEHLPLAVENYTASGNSLLAVGMPYAFYSQHKGAWHNIQERRRLQDYRESPITWCTQKQPTVGLSSFELELMATTGAACQALWLKRLLSELTGWEEKRITMKVDNISAIALVRNPVFHGRSKHIYIRYHFIHECVENGNINVEDVSGELQRADILTKALPRLKFVTMRQMLRV
nr:zinc finger, CCHC-type [Tanacetum cinerariifolium]